MRILGIEAAHGSWDGRNAQQKPDRKDCRLPYAHLVICCKRAAFFERWQMASAA